MISRHIKLLTNAPDHQISEAADDHPFNRIGKSHGDFPLPRNVDSVNDSAWSTASSRRWITRCRSGDYFHPKTWSGGKKRCRQRGRCERKINTPYLIGRKRRIGREYTVSLSIGFYLLSAYLIESRRFLAGGEGRIRIWWLARKEKC